MSPNYPGSRRSAWDHATAFLLKLRSRGVRGASAKTLLRHWDRITQYTVPGFSMHARKIPSGPQSASELRRMVRGLFSPLLSRTLVAYPSTHTENDISLLMWSKMILLS